jgi:hypothetical protein
MCSIESFKEFLQTNEDEHNKIHAKHVLAVEAWRSESIKQNTMKRHKVIFCMQAQGMKSKHQHPTLMPLPLPLLFLKNPDYHDSPCLLLISFCPFYQRLFELAWDCKIAFCKRSYHSQCVITHFSSSTKCVLEDYGEGMYLDWWTLLGVKKPSVVE